MDGEILLHREEDYVDILQCTHVGYCMQQLLETHRRKGKKQADPVQWLLAQEVVDPGITSLNVGKIEKGAFVQIIKTVATINIGNTVRRTSITKTVDLRFPIPKLDSSGQRLIQNHLGQSTWKL